MRAGGWALKVGGQNLTPRSAVIGFVWAPVVKKRAGEIAAHATSNVEPRFDNTCRAKPADATRWNTTCLADSKWVVLLVPYVAHDTVTLE
eukprot:6504990-Pyramimonas_sp.AAC.1